MKLAEVPFATKMVASWNVNVLNVIWEIVRRNESANVNENVNVNENDEMAHSSFVVPVRALLHAHENENGPMNDRVNGEHLAFDLHSEV